ncbi:crosslink repair DNA glycosylase YcaQ family protein [Maribacter sp. BPC-D8]|uniref:winged helix-turn-helix domain-containing protein n=1 Tax=Maribacter sp. BPC-D8 TaxID=3053613 RepID=UPI002B49C8CC|nr:crosslink repair DNA glycosylase YcaQ family protein [Maribacter sp. BPC-D8]WRI30674.1 crosslink repair DNA glycosylase YcaQ family protein [Maribacter sp. BPC-D8]
MSSNEKSISLREAQKLVLLSQRLLGQKLVGSTKNATLAAIEHLGYVQIDTISVIERAHHHTLYNRNSSYNSNHLQTLVSDKKVFEYWAHAASYLPMIDYRFSLPRKHAIASGKQKHWFKRDEKLMESVRDRIKSEGPLMAKNFDKKGVKHGEWKTAPTKQALENLFMEGELMITERINFHKVYDLTERVLPETVNTNTPTEDEYGRFLIKKFLRANGIGKLSEMTYLLKNIKPLVSKTLKLMVADGEIELINVLDNQYYILPESFELLNKPLPRKKLKILSPFDNLLIQRKRAKEIFEYDYLLECYVPQHKRKHGYFTLPILWDGKLVARMDSKVDRKEKILDIHQLTLEPSLTKTEAFAVAFNKELQSFLKFNNCNGVRLHKTSPINFKNEFERLITSVEL